MNSATATDTSIHFIDSDTLLLTTCQHLATQTVIAVDTEFHRVSTYFPKLCLIQIATEERVFCIDPFEVQDFSPLQAIFNTDTITKVFHSCQQDMEVLYQGLGCIPAPLFDTQVAANCLGFGRQMGYANLMAELLDVHLDKSQTRTDWTQRPLSAAQLQYAAEDVIPLLKAFHLLAEKMAASNKGAEFKATISSLLEERRYITDANVGAKKIRGIRRLKGQPKQMAEALAVWREQQAIAHNLPRQWVIKDVYLLEIAKKNPVNTACLEVLGIPKKQIKRYADELFSVMEAVKLKRV